MQQGTSYADPRGICKLAVMSVESQQWICQPVESAFEWGDVLIATSHVDQS